MAANRILVKAAPGLTSVRLTYGTAHVTFKAAPLFKRITPAPAPAAAAPVWQLLTAEGDLSGEDAWDACYSLLQDGFRIAGTAPPRFAEPDLEQRWIAGSDAELGMALAQACDKADEQNADFPRVVGNPYWFRDSDHSQFDAAIAAIGGPDVADKVRIAHLDTGYDPGHSSLPKRLRKDLAHNFVDDGGPNDASDQTNGLFNNLGHGTGTLSILAGTRTTVDATSRSP
jgi:hypothetical protein